MPMLRRGYGAVRNLRCKSGARFPPSTVQTGFSPQTRSGWTQVGHNNDPDGSGKLSQLTRKGLVSALTETGNT